MYTGRYEILEHYNPLYFYIGAKDSKIQHKKLNPMTCTINFSQFEAPIDCFKAVRANHELRNDLEKDINKWIETINQVS